MSSVGLYGFDIPHEHITPTRDMVVIRIPFPPKKIGSIITPQLTRDLLAHNVMAGRIVNMGPLAFQFKDGTKDGTGIGTQDVKIGDWVLIRPYAGTMIQGGQMMVTSGYRYVSSFQDVIGIIPADKMPATETLIWDADDEEDEPTKSVPKKDEFADSVRERVTYAGNKK